MQPTGLPAILGAPELCIENRRIPAYSRSGMIECDRLPDGKPLVGFNGNGFRRGRGYRLFGPGGWPTRAGYDPDAAGEYLDDLVNLSTALDLVVVGVGPSDVWKTDGELRGMTASAAGRSTLASVDVRVYAPEEYKDRWSEFFGWSDWSEEDHPQADVDSLRADMRTRWISLHMLAKRIGHDPSFVSKLMGGKKPWPPGLFKRAKTAVHGR
jgi:hypothetical protein